MSRAPVRRDERLGLIYLQHVLESAGPKRRRRKRGFTKGDALAIAAVLVLLAPIVNGVLK